MPNWQCVPTPVGDGASHADTQTTKAAAAVTDSRPTVVQNRLRGRGHTTGMKSTCSKFSVLCSRVAILKKKTESVTFAGVRLERNLIDFTRGMLAQSTLTIKATLKEVRKNPECGGEVPEVSCEFRVSLPARRIPAKQVRHLRQEEGPLFR